MNQTSALLYGRRGHKYLAEEQPLPLSDRGLQIIAAAGYDRHLDPGEIIAQCGAELMHYTDYQRQQTKKATSQENISYHNRLQAAARKLYITNLKYDNQKSWTRGQPTIQSGQDCEGLSQVQSYIAAATRPRRRNQLVSEKEMITTIACLLAAAYRLNLNIDSTLRSMQANYFAGLRQQKTTNAEG